MSLAAIDLGLPPLAPTQVPDFTDVLGCQAWLAGLPMTNIAEAQSQFLRQLNLLNCTTLPDEERLIILELLRGPVDFIQEQCAQRYAGRPLPLSAAGQAAFDASQTLWQELEGQKLFAWLQLAPLFELPTREEVERMSLGRALLSMLLLDLRRPFLVSALRRRAISAKAMLFSLGGFLPSQNPKLEAAIEMARRQAWIMAKVSFLSKTQRVFHLWHVLHRPFSYSFAVLMVVHVVVAIMMGYF